MDNTNTAASRVDPLVSVIIPVYNVAGYVRAAIESVLRQTYSRLELLIVDDGSDDGSGEICDEYGRRDPRVRVFRQENRGIGAARNTGLDRMTGELVAFLDADDLYRPDMLRRMTEAMRRSRAEIAVCGIIRVRETALTDRTGGTVLSDYGKEEVLSSREALNALAEGRIFHNVWNKVYLRSVWDSLRFPEGTVYEDIQTTYRLLEAAEQIVTVPGIHVLYRKRADSISRVSSLRNALDYRLAQKLFEAYVTEHTPRVFDEGALESVRKEALLGMLLQWSMIPGAERPSARELREELVMRIKRFRSGHRAAGMAYSVLLRFPCLVPAGRSLCSLYKRITGKVTGVRRIP